MIFYLEGRKDMKKTNEKKMKLKKKGLKESKVQNEMHISPKQLEQFLRSSILLEFDTSSVYQYIYIR